MRLRSLTARGEFSRVVRTGRSSRRNGITVFVDATHTEGLPGVGLSVRMRGSAVRRNRVKRRVLAALRECPPPTRNVVVRATGEVGELQYQKLVADLRTALTNAGATG